AFATNGIPWLALGVERRNRIKRRTPGVCVEKRWRIRLLRRSLPFCLRPKFNPDSGISLRRNDRRADQQRNEACAFQQLLMCRPKLSTRFAKFRHIVPPLIKNSLRRGRPTLADQSKTSSSSIRYSHYSGRFPHWQSYRIHSY